jgi:uncharacterized membrane protein
MAFLLFAAVALIGFRLWTRLQRTDSTIKALAARVAALEHTRSPLERTVQAPSVHAAGPVTASAGAGPMLAPAPAARPTAAVPPTPGQAPVLQDAPLPRTPPRAPQPVAPAVVTAAERSPSRDREALESRIGSRWLLYVGVVAIVVGVSYFEKLAIDNHWVNETWRVIQGEAAGVLLVAGGLRIVRKGYRLYGQILCGAGVAILYVSTYAAFNFYQLISQPAAFVLMSAITTLGAWLADSQRSQSLALVAVCGGFATPFLLPSGKDAEASLFGYDSILIAGTMVLARRRDWPTLNIVSYAFTALTVVSWAAAFYAPSKYLTTELFLTIFCAMFLYALRGAHGSAAASAKLQRAVLWTAPCGYYVLSLANLYEHSSALLVYLVVLALVGVVSGSRTNARIRLLFWFAVVAPLLAWSDDRGPSVWLAGGLAAWAGVYVLNLAGLFQATLGEGSTFEDADVVLLHLNGLATYFGAYLLIEPIREIACAPLAAVFAVVNLAFASLIRQRRREEALHFVALAATLLTIAIALQLDGAWITSGWAAEGVVVVWLGLRERRRWLRVGGLALFAAAIVRLVAAETASPAVGEIVLLNSRGLSGLFVSALTYLIVYLHHRYGDPAKSKTAVTAGLVLAKLVLLSVTASEIVAYWKLHDPPPFEPDAQVILVSMMAGAAIMWLGLRRREEWVRATGGGVLGMALFALFSIQLQEASPVYVTALNGRAMAGVVAILVLYALVVVHRRIGSHVAQLPMNIAVFTTTASLLTLSLLTSEIDAFWAVRGASSLWSVSRQGLQSVAWAGIGGFLIWYGLSVRRMWCRGIGGALLLVAVTRLLLVHFADAPGAYVIVANARVMTSIVVIAVLYGLAHLYNGDAAKDLPDRAGNDPEEGRAMPATVLRLVANILTLTLLTSEITAYWHVFDARHTSESASTNMQFAREMMLSITWAVYATVLVIVGLIRKYAPIRYFAMTVFAVTIVKVFAIDLAELDRIYRVLSVIGLGVALLVTSYLYQKLSAGEEPGIG